MATITLIFFVFSVWYVRVKEQEDDWFCAICMGALMTLAMLAVLSAVVLLGFECYDELASFIDFIKK